MSAAPIADNQPASPIILVVEDEVLIRMMIAQELRLAGLTVVEAADADEAMRVLKSLPRIRVIMTDLSMPGSMDGTRLALTVQATWPHIKIVIVSAFTPQWPIAGVEYTFIGKPFNPERMVERVKQLLTTTD